MTYIYTLSDLASGHLKDCNSLLILPGYLHRDKKSDHIYIYIKLFWFIEKDKKNQMNLISHPPFLTYQNHFCSSRKDKKKNESIKDRVLLLFLRV